MLIYFDIVFPVWNWTCDPILTSALPCPLTIYIAACRLSSSRVSKPFKGNQSPINSPLTTENNYQQSFTELWPTQPSVFSRDSIALYYSIAHWRQRRRIFDRMRRQKSIKGWRQMQENTEKKEMNRTRLIDGTSWSDKVQPLNWSDMSIPGLSTAALSKSPGRRVQGDWWSIYRQRENEQWREEGGSRWRVKYSEKSTRGLTDGQQMEDSEKVMSKILVLDSFDYLSHMKCYHL